MIKAENQNCVINGKPISIFQKQDPNNRKKDNACAKYMVVFTGIFTPWRRLRHT